MRSPIKKGSKLSNLPAASRPKAYNFLIRNIALQDIPYVSFPMRPWLKLELKGATFRTQKYATFSFDIREIFIHISFAVIDKLTKDVTYFSWKNLLLNSMQLITKQVWRLTFALSTRFRFDQRLRLLELNFEYWSTSLSR